MNVSRRVVIRLLALVAGVVAAVALLEAFAAGGWLDFRFLVGVDARQVPAPHAPEKHLSGEIDGDLVRHYGLTGFPKYSFDVHTDRRGFRNPTTRERADIAVLGDSFVENPLVAVDATFPAVLAAELGRDIVNLGRSGFGPQHELDVLRTVVPPLQPRLVVWVFFEGNDLEDLRVMSGARPARFADRSLLRNLGVWAADALRAPPAPPFPSCRFATADAGRVELYFGFRPFPLTWQQREDAAAFALILAEAAQMARGLDARFVLAFAPAKFRVYDGLCAVAPDNPVATWQLGDLPQRLERAAAQQQLDFIDLTPALRVAASRGELVYHPDDTHWTAVGNRVVGLALAERFRSLDP